MKNIKLIAVAGIAFILLGASSCRSKRNNQNNRRTTSNQRQQRPDGQRRTPAQIITQMDRNNDGKLSADEVKGPLKNNFASIDTNHDGFLTKAEIQNAPRPTRGNGQGRPVRR